MNFLGNKFFVIGSIVFMLIAIPASLFLLKQQQQVKTKATAASVLSIEPATKTVAVGDTFDVNVVVTPNQNHVNNVVFGLQFDPTKLQFVNVAPSESMPLVVAQLVKTDNSIKFGVTTGTSLERTILEATAAAKVTFKALAPTSDPTKITFDETVAYIISNNEPADQPNENVFASSIPGSVIITAGSTVTPSPSVSPTIPVATQTVNAVPVCSALNVDRTPTGSAPFSITYTGNGNDSDGTISKATFDFGDGPTKDVTVGSGIGTNTASVQIAHTYNNPGTYTASVTFTDNRSGISSIGSCTQTITVTQAETPTRTTEPVVVVTQPPAQPTIAPTGDTTSTLTIIGGIVGTITIGVLLFAL